MEFTDDDKAARAESLTQFPGRDLRARPKRYARKRRKRTKPKTFGAVLDNFKADIRDAYRSGWKVDILILPFPPQAYRMLHVKRDTITDTIEKKLARRGLTVTKVFKYGTELWFLVST